MHVNVPPPTLLAIGSGQMNRAQAAHANFTDQATRSQATGYIDAGINHPHTVVCVADGNPIFGSIANQFIDQRLDLLRYVCS